MLKVLSMAQDTLAETPTAEEIQDIVEEVLLSSPYRRDDAMPQGTP